jgi:hypothetical protein
MIRECKQCQNKYPMNRQGIDEFCSIDCMIQYFTEIINYDHECMRTESIIEDIIERAFEAGQWTCECDV